MKLVQQDRNGTGLYQVPDSYLTHLAETYSDRIQFEKTIVGNIVSTELKFADEATRLQYEADPAVLEQQQLREAHNAANGIVTRKEFN